MLTEAKVRKIAQREAAQMLVDVAHALNAIVAAHPGQPMSAEDVDRALGAVAVPILKP